MVEIRIIGEALIKTINVLESYQYELESKIRVYEKHMDDEKHERRMAQVNKQLKTVKELIMVYKTGMYDNSK